MKVLNPDFDIDEFWARLGSTKQGLIMLDYDGTLAPFTEDRDNAVPYPGVKKHIASLMALTNCIIVIITGRDTNQLVSLLGIYPHPEIWGSHGLEVLHSDDTTSPANIPPEQKQALKKASEWCIDQHMEEQIEKKTGCVALHTRGMDSNSARRCESKVKDAWTPIAQQTNLIIKNFDGGIEIRVKESNKANAVNQLLEKFPNAVSAYLGDDLTDEDAFAALKGKGLCVLVRDKLKPTLADIWIRPPEELIGFLERFEQTLKRE